MKLDIILEQITLIGVDGMLIQMQILHFLVGQLIIVQIPKVAVQIIHHLKLEQL